MFSFSDETEGDLRLSTEAEYEAVSAESTEKDRSFVAVLQVSPLPLSLLESLKSLCLSTN